MANIVNFSEYGFINDILALNENNWRRYFKPAMYDSVQSGLETSAATDMRIVISAGECRCGSVMGILNNSVFLDIDVGDSVYARIDSVVVQYENGIPSSLSLAVLQGTPAPTPVAPTLTKTFNTLWQMELAQILVPANASSSSEFVITDKRVVYNSIDSVISPIKTDISDIDNEITNINTDMGFITEDISQLRKNILYYYQQPVSAITSGQILRIPASGSDANITTNTVVLECTFATPSSITSNVSWTSYAGYITFTGTCTAATTANVTLGQKGN